MTDPQNTAVDLADAAIKKLLTDILIKKAIKEAIEEVAWLALPVINPIFVLAMNFAAKFLYKKTALEAAFFIIDKQTGHQDSTYRAEMEDYRKAIEQGKTNEEIERERIEAEKRLADLIKYSTH